MVEETFQRTGPLGVVWAHHARTGSGSNAEDYACIKSVKPSSVAAGRPALQPGLILGYVNGEYVKGQDYCEQNRILHEVCALGLIAHLCWQSTPSTLSDPRARSRSALSTL